MKINHILIKDALKKAKALEKEHIPTKKELLREESKFYHEAMMLKKLTTKRKKKLKRN